MGLLYDEGALDAAWDMVKTWTPDEHHALRSEVPKHALKTRFRNRTVADLAREVLEIAAAGLRSRGETDPYGEDEAHFLDALFVIMEKGRTPAEEHLEAFNGRWEGLGRPDLHRERVLTREGWPVVRCAGAGASGRRAPQVRREGHAARLGG